MIWPLTRAQTRRAWLLLTLWALSCAACERDYEPYYGSQPSSTLNLAGLDERCQTAQACRPGLTCMLGGVCAEPTCAQSQDPERWCQRFGQPQTTCQQGVCAVALGPPVELPEAPAQPPLVCASAQACAPGFRCERSRCLRQCERPEDCPYASTCIWLSSGQGRVCGDPTWAKWPLPGCVDEPSKHQRCAQQLERPPGAAWCSLRQGGCVMTERLDQSLIVILDRSEGSACQARLAFGQPGAQAQGTALVALDFIGPEQDLHAQVFWSDLRASEPTALHDTNALESFGLAPADERGCPNPRPALSLGCGGWIAVRPARADEPQPLSRALWLRVTELEPRCDSSDLEPAQHEVYRCQPSFFSEGLQACQRLQTTQDQGPYWLYALSP